MSASSRKSVNDDAVTELQAELSQLRQDYAALSQEVDQLRAAYSRRTGNEQQPVINKQFTTVLDGYENDPRHDPEFLEADRRAYLSHLSGSPGSFEDSAAAEAAYAAARERIGANQPAGPGRMSDFERIDAVHRNRRENAQAPLDMTSQPIEPGAVVTWSEDRKQAHIRYPDPRTCSGGHPVPEGYNACPDCGSTVIGIGALREAEDRQLLFGGRPEQDVSLAEQNLLAESTGNYPKLR